MRKALMLIGLSLAPALAAEAPCGSGRPCVVDRPLALTVDQLPALAAASLEPCPHPTRHARPCLAQRPIRPAERWITLGMPMGLSLWRQRGYRTAFATAIGADAELGYGALGLRPSVNLHLGGETVDLDFGLGAAVRTRTDPHRSGALLGVHAALGSSPRGMRAVLGPEIGLAGVHELRLRVGATWAPRGATMWQSLGPNRPGVLFEVSWRNNMRL